MKKPSQKIKKAMTGYDRCCAYLYKDGTVINHEVELKYGKKTIKQSLIEIFPEENKIYCDSYDFGFQGRLVFHNASLLVNGVERVTIYPKDKSGSNKSKELGIQFETVIIETPDLMRINFHNFDFLSHDVTVQNDKKMSCFDWEDGLYGEKVIIHETGAKTKTLAEIEA